MSSPSDFPEKVDLARYDSGRVYITDDPDCTRREGRPVQSYFSASLVAELVEALREIHGETQEVAHEVEDPLSACETIRLAAEKAFSKAQSSLGVKG
jgi:predicted HicB family RNase H-like nuclease